MASHGFSTSFDLLVGVCLHLTMGEFSENEHGSALMACR